MKFTCKLVRVWLVMGYLLYDFGCFDCFSRRSKALLSFAILVNCQAMAWFFTFGTLCLMDLPLPFVYGAEPPNIELFWDITGLETFEHSD